MKELKYFILSLVYLSYACKEAPTIAPTQVHAMVDTLDTEFLTIKSINSGILDTIYPLSSTQSFSYHLENDDIITIQQGYQFQYFYASPGSETTLTRAKIDTAVHISSKHQTENDLLVEYMDMELDAKTSFPTFDIGEKEEEEFLNTLEEKYAKIRAFDKSIASNLELKETLKQNLSNCTNALYAMDLMSYPNIYEYKNDKAPELSPSFFEPIDEVELNNTLLTLAPSKSFLISYNSQGFDFKKFESVSDYYSALFENSKKKFDNPLLAQYVQTDLLINQLNFGSGIDGIGDAITDYRGKVTNKYLESTLDHALAPWALLKNGMQAPDITGSTRDGKQVNLSELKGKAVYVDVWATWCGPCIAEIPSLKTLEKDMHDQDVEFVSISIDELKDKEKWLTFIAEKELGGIQLMAENAWQSEVASNYNIKGIPRFLLINKDGMIESANAPRPSDPKLQEKLIEIL